MAFAEVAIQYGQFRQETLYRLCWFLLACDDLLGCEDYLGDFVIALNVGLTRRCHDSRTDANVHF